MLPNRLDIIGEPKDTRIVVAMSGGVDSCVTAALLKKQGYDVIGVTLQLYDHGQAVQRKGACCAGQDIHDARRVADLLGIPHYVLDYEKRFRDSVINPFMDSYMRGETPVPCISCNQTVKFSDLLQTARSLNAAALATGHYIGSRPGAGGHRVLFRPEDHERDQSYFLFATTQEQIDFLRFPLADLTKVQVRQIAEELQLPVAQKRDSQDICFVPKGNYADMIERLHPDAARPGEIVHINRQVLGHHKGVIHYTIGQRRGLGIAVGDPLYVVDIDPEQRRIIVGPKEALAVHTVHLRDVNWLGDTALNQLPQDGLPIYTKMRSTRKPAPTRLYRQATGVYVVLNTPEQGISPGQACVFYQDATHHTRILGGGWIQSTEKSMDDLTHKAADYTPSDFLHA